MRRVVLSLLLWSLGAALSFAQEVGDRQLWQRLGLTEQESEQVLAVFDRTEQTIRQSRLEIDVLKAELKKLLFQEKVDMQEVEKLLRSSLEWEYRLRLAQITRQVDLRRLLGDRKYARLLEAVKRRGQNSGAAGDSGQGDPGKANAGRKGSR